MGYLGEISWIWVVFQFRKLKNKYWWKIVMSKYEEWCVKQFCKHIFIISLKSKTIWVWLYVARIQRRQRQFLILSWIFKIKLNLKMKHFGWRNRRGSYYSEINTICIEPNLEISEEEISYSTNIFSWIAYSELPT